MRKAPLLTDPVFWFATMGYLVLLVTWAYLLATPAPVYKPKPVAQVTPGSYKVCWGSYAGEATLYPNGAWECDWSIFNGKERWYGAWRWNKATRVFTVIEQKALSETLSERVEWWVGLNTQLKGENGRGKLAHKEEETYHNLTIELTPARPAVPGQIKEIGLEKVNN